MIVVLLICAYHPAFAQKEDQAESKAEIFTAKNSVYLELLGNSNSYGLNFSRVIHQKGAFKLAPSLGFSLIYRERSQPMSSFISPSLSGEINALWGRSKGHLELGMGLVTHREIQFVIDESFPNNIREEPFWGTRITPRIGYRYQKPNGGIFFRAAYTPWIEFDGFEGTEEKVRFIPLGLGISLGWSFN